MSLSFCHDHDREEIEQKSRNWHFLRRGTAVTTLVLTLSTAGTLAAAGPATADADSCSKYLTSAQEANNAALDYDVPQADHQKALEKNAVTKRALRNALGECEGVLSEEAYGKVKFASQQVELAHTFNASGSVVPAWQAETIAAMNIKQALEALAG